MPPGRIGTETALSTTVISSNSAMLDSVIELWKCNRSTLGLFPRGAFEDHARQNWIIYLLEHNAVKGYLLYRIARSRVVISHLCVSKDIRGKGGARLLFRKLKNETDDGHCRGIEVRCRSDYEISLMWPRLGFECMQNINGRAKSGSELTIWFYRYDVSDFFYDMLPRQNEDDLTWAILDANIVFKLANPDKIDSEEACALLSDSLSPYIRYFVTPEVFVETERKKDREEKDRSNKSARKFEKVEVKQSALEKYQRLLKPIWGDIKTDRDRSDLNHIAYSSAAGFQYFITQDTELLDKSESIYESCSITLLRPVEFITRLDQIENSEKYTPRSIASTIYNICTPTYTDIEVIAECFCMPHLGEKRKVLEAIIRSAIANPDQYITMFVTSEDGSPVAFLCFRRTPTELIIQIMRHCGDVTSKTIAQNIAWNEIFSVSEQIILIVFSDEISSKLNGELFHARGFIKSEEGWVRISSNLVCSIDAAKKHIGNFIDTSEVISSHARSKLNHFFGEENQHTSYYEEVFWPLKIDTNDIPTYLVPIKPAWALHLFDEHLAEQELWGADPSKHFNIENVYYRSPKSFAMERGARILWYVSSSGKNKISEIRACSRLISVETGSAKTLFKRYQRLGIYEWRNLMEVTKNDPAGLVMALRFHQTEYFKHPVSLDSFKTYGIKGQPFSPRNLSNEQFLKIYKDGMDKNEQ